MLYLFFKNEKTSMFDFSPIFCPSCRYHFIEYAYFLIHTVFGFSEINVHTLWPVSSSIAEKLK